MKREPIILPRCYSTPTMAVVFSYPCLTTSCLVLFWWQEKRKERLEEETRAQRRIAARRRTRDLLLERAKQRLLAAAVAAAAADVAAPNDAASHTEQPDGGGAGDKPSLARGGRDGKVAVDVLPGDGTGMPLYAQETSAARHSKVSGRGVLEMGVGRHTFLVFVFRPNGVSRGLSLVRHQG